MRRLFLFTSLLLALYTARAQSPELILHDQPGIIFKSPVIASATAGHLLVIDMPQAGTTPLYVFDSAFLLKQVRYLPAAAYYGWRGKSGDTLICSWMDAQVHVYYMAANGDSLLHQALPVQQGWLPLATEADSEGRYILFYQSGQTRNRQWMVKGQLLNRYSGRLYPVQMQVDVDADLERSMGPLVDARGSVHTLVYDKLTSYRLSATVRMHTLSPERNDTLSTDAYQFDKVKWYDAVFYDNSATGGLVFQGMYYNGADKTKTGLSTLVFPYARGSQIKQRFTPFSTLQQSILTEGLTNINFRFPQLDYMKVSGLYPMQNRLFISAWMLDMPYKQFNKDAEQEMFSNIQPSSWLKNARNAYAPPGAAKAATRNGLRDGNSQPTTTLRDRVVGGNAMLSQNMLVPPTISNTGTANTSGSKTTRTETPAQLLMPRLGKLVYFSLDSTGGFDWFQVADNTFPVMQATPTPWLHNNPMYVNGKYYFLHTVTASANLGENRFRMHLSTVGKQGALRQPISELLTGTRIFLVPVAVRPGVFAAIYLGAEQAASGIAEIRL